MSCTRRRAPLEALYAFEVAAQQAYLSKVLQQAACWSVVDRLAAGLVEWSGRSLGCRENCGLDSRSQ